MAFFIIFKGLSLKHIKQFFLEGERPTLSDKLYGKQAFPYLPAVKHGYNASRDAPISLARYFNQRLLNFNQSATTLETTTIY